MSELSKLIEINSNIEKYILFFGKIFSALMEEIPEVRDVVLDTSVSEDLIDMAKKILRGEMK